METYDFYLLEIHPSGCSRVFKLFNNGNIMTIGRYTDASLQIEYVGISRQHATMKLDDDQVYIRDHSSNGTFVNNIRLEKETYISIKENDYLRFSATHIKYQLKRMPCGMKPLITTEVYEIDENDRITIENTQKNKMIAKIDPSPECIGVTERKVKFDDNATIIE